MELLPFFYLPGAHYPRLMRQDLVASADAAEATRAARRAETSTDVLQGQVDRLALAVEALWTLLRDKTGITDDELRDRIRDIDLKDGKLDGKVSRAPSTCQACGRVVSKRHRRCLYCGAEVDAPAIGE